MRAAAILLQQALERRGPCRILAARERPWASATFIGARHRLRLAVAEAPFLDGIEEAEFDLGEYLLADIVVVQREWAGEELIVDVEALTIEDWRDPLLSRPSPRWRQGKASPANRRIAERSALLCRWQRHERNESLLCRRCAARHHAQEGRPWLGLP